MLRASKNVRSLVVGSSLIAACALLSLSPARLARAAARPTEASGETRLDTTAAVSGHWQSVDDKTGQPGALIRTWVANGKLYGAIEKVLKKDAPPDPRCQKCSGYFKDKPLVGLQIMWDLSADGDGWSGGSILDPESGSVYHCKVTPAAGGKLEVRGFVGISAFGRTQTWTRVS